MNEISQALYTALGWTLTGAPFAVSMLLALLLPIAVVVTSHGLRSVPNNIKLTLIVSAIVLGSTFSIAFSGRILVNENDPASFQNLLATMDSTEGNPWISRISHLLILTIACSEIFLWATKKIKINESIYGLWLTAILFYLASNIISGIFGARGDYSLRIIYAPIIFTAIALLIDEKYQEFLTKIRLVLFIPLVTSLILIYANPPLVIEYGYKSPIPGFSIRLAGIADHANSLGILAAITFLLEFSRLKTHSINKIFLLTSGCCLILSQSKTSWIIALIGMAVMYRKSFIQKNTHALPKIEDMIAIILLLIAASGILVYKSTSILEFFEQDKTGLTSFTGRTKIWALTIDEFVNNPIFGYGPTIWGHDYRYLKGLLYVGQAHNQYIQTLGQAGLIGMGFLLIYIFKLIKSSLSKNHSMAPLAITLVMTLLVRGLSESPMRMQSILDIDTFVHLIAFATAASIIYRPFETSRREVLNFST